MKISLIVIIFIAFIMAIAPPARAADASVSAKAQDLLDRVATKVAEQASKLQKSYWGKIKSLGTTSIVITTESGERAISTNDATAFFRVRGGSRTDINFAGLKIGDDIAAVGTIDPTTLDLTARQVIAKIKRTNLVGRITSINKSILTVDTTTKIDLADATLKKIATDSAKITVGRENDFKEGATIFAIIHSPDQNSGVFSILKALVFTKL